ncbi:hypothetical protein HanPI659440_Chr15g0595141 [Helianthus annuus]|nr:hypothetical protein HanPI659440_Chr15g0595141 [Helianthus annuus]
MAIVSLCYSAPPAHFSKLGFHQNPICRPDSSSVNLHRVSFTHSISILRFFIINRSIILFNFTVFIIHKNVTFFIITSLLSVMLILCILY